MAGLIPPSWSGRAFLVSSPLAGLIPPSWSDPTFLSDPASLVRPRLPQLMPGVDNCRRARLFRTLRRWPPIRWKRGRPPGRAGSRLAAVLDPRLGCSYWAEAGGRRCEADTSRWAGGPDRRSATSVSTIGSSVPTTPKPELSLRTVVPRQGGKACLDPAPPSVFWLRIGAVRGVWVGCRSGGQPAFRAGETLPQERARSQPDWLPDPEPSSKAPLASHATRAAACR